MTEIEEDPNNLYFFLEICGEVAFVMAFNAAVELCNMIEQCLGDMSTSMVPARFDSENADGGFS